MPGATSLGLAQHSENAFENLVYSYKMHTCDNAAQPSGLYAERNKVDARDKWRPQLWVDLKTGTHRNSGKVLMGVWGRGSGRWSALPCGKDSSGSGTSSPTLWPD